MKIAHITATFPPYYGGTGAVCYHNAHELATLGHDVTVITAKYANTKKCNDPPGVTVKRLSPMFRFGNAPFLPDILNLNGFDIIHLHYPFIFGAELVWKMAKRTNTPYIITYHNDLIGEGLRKYLFDGYSYVSHRLVFKDAKKIGVTSYDFGKHCGASPFFKERWSDVVEIPNGVDTDVFRPDLASDWICRKYNIPSGAKVILFVGGLDQAHYFKGVDRLIKAFAKLKFNNTVLLIVGEGDLKPDYIALADKLGVLSKVVFVGQIPNPGLPPYYNIADMVILPSSFLESFGMVLIEGMACGKPVIASNIPGVRSVINHNQDGLLVEPWDVDDLKEKMETLLQKPEKRRVMGHKGRAKVEAKYAWSAIAMRLEYIYKGMLGLQV
ncbi:MAG: hypothetical protein B6242_08810 [Anaerolineaceae bacterium 4572_78]|nr:MAG: hypothetical protein B6242_08810 [Anaerolineaceae bacterium 4572_78]